MKASLYELSAVYMAAMEALTNPEADIDAQTIADTMEAVEGNLGDKLLNVARFISSIEAEAEAIKTVAKRQADRGKALDNKAAMLRTYLRENMELTGLTSIRAADIALSLAKLPGSLVIDDESLIPVEFRRVVEVISWDKVAIKAAGNIAGTHISTGFRVSIK